MSIRLNHFYLALGFLIAFYVFDIPRFFVEIFAVPLVPRLGGRPPYLFPAILLLCVAMLTVNWQSGRRLGFEVADLLIVIVVFYFVFAELLVTPEGGRNFDLALDLLLIYSGYFCVRLYRDCLGGTKLLTEAFLWTLVGYVGLHFILLIMANAGVLPIFIDISEVVSQNQISLVALFIPFYFLFMRRGRPLGGYVWCIIGFVALHAYLNDARAVLLLLGAVVVLRFAFRADRSHTGAMLAMAAALVALGAITLAAPSLLQELASSFGQGDARLSAESRLLTNYLLVQLWLAEPLFGIGAAAVAQVTVTGYMSHTLPIMLLSAYGLVGAMFVWGLAWSISHVRVFHLPAATTFLFMLVVLSVVNDGLPWLGAVLGLAVLRYPIEPEIRVQMVRSPADA